MPNTGEIVTEQEAIDFCKKDQILKQLLAGPHHRVHYVRIVHRSPRNHLLQPHSTTYQHGTNDTPGTSSAPEPVHPQAAHRSRESYPNEKQKEYTWQSLQEAMIHDSEQNIRQIQLTERDLRRRQRHHTFPRPAESDDDTMAERLQ